MSKPVVALQVDGNTYPLNVYEKGDNGDEKLKLGANGKANVEGARCQINAHITEISSD